MPDLYQQFSDLVLLNNNDLNLNPLKFQVCLMNILHSHYMHHIFAPHYSLLHLKNNQCFSSADTPPYTIFLVSGISVDDLSSPTNIILKNTSLDTSGQYKCEVSGGPPRYIILIFIYLVNV